MAADAGLRYRLAEALDRLAGAVARHTEAERSSDRVTRLQERLRLLGQLAAGFATASPELVERDVAGYGSVVETIDLDTLEQVRYTIVSAQSIDLDAGHVSLASPIGQALLGSQVGDVVTFETPRGRRRLRVANVTTLYDLLDGIAA